MAQERTAGNGNFDIDAIARLVNGIGNAPAIVNQPTELTPEEQRSVDQILDTVEEFAANRSGGSGNELGAMLVTSIAARLPAGVTSQIASAIFLEVERRDRSGFAESGATEWERAKKEAKDEREARDKTADVSEDILNVAQHQEQQRQARSEAWRNSDHEFAGKRMSGVEWMQMIQWFRASENRAEWEDAMIAETGQTREQVRATGTRMDRYFDLMEKQANGETLTPDEQREFNRLDRDPEIRRGVTTMQNLQANRPSLDASATSTGSANIEGDLRNGSLDTRQVERTSLYDDRGPANATAAGGPTAPISVAATLDDSVRGTTTPTLSATFRAAASPTVLAPTLAIAPAVAPQIASNTVDFGVANM